MFGLMAAEVLFTPVSGITVGEATDKLAQRVIPGQFIHGGGGIAHSTNQLYQGGRPGDDGGMPRNMVSGRIVSIESVAAVEMRWVM